MRLRHAIAAVALVAAALAGLPAAAQTVVSTTPGPLQTIAQQVYPIMETMTGMPIAVLTRSDSDTANFYYMAMQTLCAKTNSNWCDTDLYTVLTDTTNQMGWIQVLNYTDPNGNNASVCVVLPPTPGLDPGYAATEISGGSTTFDWRDLPTTDEMEAWLTLLYAAECQNKLVDDPTEQKRNDAFASLGLTLMEGDFQFVADRDVTPARKFSFYRNSTSTGWAVNIGERILLELWKTQAATLLSQTPCQISAVASTNLNTAIQRDVALPPTQNCTTTGPNVTTGGGNGQGGTTQATTQQAVGSVTDANLWLWSYPAWGLTATWPTVAMPPQPYTAFETFPSLTAAVTYMWQTGQSLSTQY